jgi:hypothetical protein
MQLLPPSRTRLVGVAVTLAALLCANASAASSTDDAVTRANHMAYDAAIKCFVADAYASDERRKAGDAAKSAAYHTMSRVSFDVAFTAGTKIGFDDDKVNRDLEFAQETELPRFIRDQKYLLDTAATCKAMGLM